MNSTDFPWALPPFAHQAKIFDDTAEAEGFGLHLEQGTGKACIGIATAANAAMHGRINRLLVVAPNEVHTNWVTDELPAHMPGCLPYKAIAYDTKKADTKQFQERLLEVAKFDGLQVLAMTYDAIKTKAGEPLAERFLRTRPAMMVCDESHRIKTFKAEQSKVCRRLGRFAKMRRTMTGTPMSKDPSDFYAQILFIDPTFWARHGYPTKAAFMAEFAIMGSKPWSKQPVAVAWRQLDHLHAILKEISVRVLKKDVLDLPEKLYSKLGFDLSPAQRRIYDQLRLEFRTELESGLEITAPMAAVRITRLAQVACNYLPTGEGEVYEQIDPAHNPRLNLLGERLEAAGSLQAIVWHRFREDGRLIAERLREMELTCARWDGTVSPDDRQKAKAAFKAGDVQFLVANPATISTGVTLNEAKSVFVYSCSYNLEQRLQSEDRCHRIGQKDAVLYTDFVGRKTVDELVVKNLVGKNALAMTVNGDAWREWIS